MKHTKETAIEAAIDQLKGKEISPGRPVACRQENYAMELIRYEGDEAVCKHHQGEKRFPRADIFDLNEVYRLAEQLLYSEDNGDHGVIVLSL